LKENIILDKSFDFAIHLHLFPKLLLGKSSVKLRFNREEASLGMKQSFKIFLPKRELGKKERKKAGAWEEGKEKSGSVGRRKIPL